MDDQEWEQIKLRLKASGIIRKIRDIYSNVLMGCLLLTVIYVAVFWNSWSSAHTLVPFMLLVGCLYSFLSMQNVMKEGGEGEELCELLVELGHHDLADKIRGSDRKSRY